MLGLYIWHKDINFLLAAGLYGIAAEVRLLTHSYDKKNNLFIDETN